MAWLWNSWEEYVNAVHPVALDSPNRVRLSHIESWFEAEQSLYKSIRELEERSEALQELGFRREAVAPREYDRDLVAKAKPLVMDAVYFAEELLLYHKRLAKSKAAYGFLHQHSLPDHWHRYAQTSRIVFEIGQFMSDVNELLKGLNSTTEDDHEFLIGIIDMPKDLEEDFLLSRNLFSVGFDDVGLLIAGRGLEGVLRKIAKIRNVSLESKGKPVPASETSLNDLIEAMYQLRWKAKQTRLIPPETKALLHYLRTLRNEGAHPDARARSVADQREKAAVFAETASRLWKEVSGTRARLHPTVIQKTW